MEIFTIGHSNHDLDEFIALLRAHDIEQIIDIRGLPGSRKYPHFNREQLSKSLRNHHIAYRHLAKLGGRRRVNKDSTANLGWRNASFRGFADYMQTEQFEEGLNQLLALAAKKRVAIMCAEAVPWRCHRSMVADALVARGIKVMSIFSRTSAKEHKLNPMAHKSHGHLIYPDEKAS